MSLTGYLTRSGVDLSCIFQSGNSGIITGFKLTNDQYDWRISSGYS